MSTGTERELLADAVTSETDEGSIHVLGLEEPHGGPQIQKARRMYLAAGVLLGSALAVAVIFTAMPHRSALHAGPASTFTEDFLDFKMPSTVKEYKKLKLPLPKPDECALATVQNCAKSQCCDNFGFQCYAKNATFGACMKKCEPAKLTKQGNGTWTCEPLGLRNRCANLTEDCSAFGCCADDNYQCYELSEGKAMCKRTCEGGSCAAIGPRNTHMYEDDAYRGLMSTAPPLKTCSRIGESCAETKCCRWSGYDCYEKNATWASCLTSCFPGKPNGGVTNFPMFQAGAPEDNPPKHWAPYFEEVGSGPWTCKHLTPPLVRGEQRGTSLYCYTVALSDNGGKKKLDELEIVKTAQMAGAGVFGCDKWDVFSDKVVKLNPGSTIKVDYTKVLASNGSAVKRPNTQIFVNTLVFMNVWKYIKKQTTWMSFSWVVKVDTTTVFIPDRLRTILSHQLVTEKGVYMENCKYVRMSFHGSMEVISKDAFGILLDNLDDCLETLPWKNGTHAHFKYYGEDKFLQFCMDKHGITRVPSRQMVDNVPKDQNIFGLHLTVSCPGHRTKFETMIKKYHPNCSRSVTAGLHPFKTPEAWLECLKNTTQIPSSQAMWPSLTA